MLEIVAKAADITGIIGVVLLLIAYYLLNVNKLSAFSLSYQVLNLLGATFILISLMFAWNTSAVIIEVAWIVISIMGIYRALKKRKQPSQLPKLYVVNDKVMGR